MSVSFYKFLVPDSVAQQLKHLHPTIKKKIHIGLDSILKNPYQGKALTKELTGFWSYRVSHFRIVYRIQKKIIEIIAIGPRKNIYSDTYRYLKTK